MVQKLNKARNYVIVCITKLFHVIVNEKISRLNFIFLRHLPPGESTTNLMSEEFDPQLYQAERRKAAARSDEPEDPLKVAERSSDHVFYDAKTMHSILLAIPSLGKGFEHLMGTTPKVGNLIKFFNNEGFLRAVPFEIPMVGERDEGSGSSMTAPAHASQTSLTSVASSNASLTGSQREVFGIEEDNKWPLGSKQSIDDR